MRTTGYFLLIFSIFASACTNGHRSPRNLRSSDANYVRTGLYWLSGPSEGIKMQKENSDEIYYVRKTPFASVDNLRTFSIQKDSIHEGLHELKLEFDSKGTEDLKDGTGNSQHPKIALVLANKLLYVVRNDTKIETGQLVILLDDYNDRQLDSLRESIQSGR